MRRKHPLQLARHLSLRLLSVVHELFITEMDFSLPSTPAIGAVIPSRYEATSMRYHEDGKRLFVAYEGGSLLQAIDCMSGSAAKPAVKCEDEQIHCVEAT